MYSVSSLESRKGRTISRSEALSGDPMLHEDRRTSRMTSG